MRTKLQTNENTVLETATEQAKVVVGKGWDVVRNINWKDMTRKEPESNGSKMWGRLLEATAAATEQARQAVTDKYYDFRDGPYGTFPVFFGSDLEESDDDTPDNTHTQRALANYYMSTEGALPPWLPPPVLPVTKSSNGTSSPMGSTASGYRNVSNPVSLKDIYESTGPNRSPPRTRNQDLYAQDQNSYGRQPSGDRLRQKLRPSNTRPTAQARAVEQPVSGYNEYNSRGGGYPTRSRSEEEYDPFNYQRQPGPDHRQRQYSAGLSSRSVGRI